MQIITLNDKSFKEFIPEKKILERVAEIAAELDQDFSGKEPLFLPVLNGAFIFAADLLRAMELEGSVQFVRLSTYGDEMSSSRSVKAAYGLNNLKAKDRHLVIIEDITDTGFTSRYLRDYFAEQEAASVSLVTLLFKPESFKQDVKPEYIGFEIPEDFVVGYGMDYAQKGRQYRSIYHLHE